MSTKNPAKDVKPMAFVNTAREYRAAADALLTVSEQMAKEGSHTKFTDPIYFLYFHTIELALKGYLRASGVSMIGKKRRTHELLKLYEECRQLGLVVGPDDRFDIRNVIDLLETSNEFQGLRYFSLKSRTLPDLAWTRTAVGLLVTTVESEVLQRFPGSNVPGPAARVNMIFSKASPK
jgi:hypothetical protein